MHPTTLDQTRIYWTGALRRSFDPPVSKHLGRRDQAVAISRQHSKPFTERDGQITILTAEVSGTRGLFAQRWAALYGFGGALRSLQCSTHITVSISTLAFLWPEKLISGRTRIVWAIRDVECAVEAERLHAPLFAAGFVEDIGKRDGLVVELVGQVRGEYGSRQRNGRLNFHAEFPGHRGRE